MGDSNNSKILVGDREDLPPSDGLNYYNVDNIMANKEQEEERLKMVNSQGNTVYHKDEFFVISDLVDIEQVSPNKHKKDKEYELKKYKEKVDAMDTTTIVLPSNGGNHSEESTGDNMRRINLSPRVSDLIEVPLTPVGPNLDINKSNNLEIHTTTTTSSTNTSSSDIPPDSGGASVSDNEDEHKIIHYEMVDQLSTNHKIKEYQTQCQPTPIDLNQNQSSITNKINNNNNNIMGEKTIDETTPPFIPTSIIDTSALIKTKKDKKIEKELLEAMKEQNQHPQPPIAPQSLKDCGETIYKGHPSWLLMRTIQTGLLNCVSKTNSTSSTISMDSPDQLYESQTYVLPVIEEHPGYTFAFKDYCPHVFHKLRELSNVDNLSYVYSICKSWNEVSTPGKSGSIFFFSADNQYVLKTIPKREAKLLRELLPEYYEHIKRNPNTLLPKFFGLHRVCPKNGRQVRFLVMKNLFTTPKVITQRFDLKGSTVGRELRHEEAIKRNPTFKDLDFRRMGVKLHLGPDRKKLFMHQLAEDCKFLVKLNIMDYSLLIGLHKKSDLDAQELQEKLQQEQQQNGGTTPMLGQEDDSYSSCTDTSSDYSSDSSDDEDYQDLSSSLDKSIELQQIPTPNGSIGNGVNPKRHIRHQKKISSLSETQNYLSHLSKMSLHSSGNHTMNTNGHNHHHHHQHHHHMLYHSTEAYMKPVDIPTLPPIINETTKLPTAKPKISIFEHDKGGMQGIDQQGNALNEFYFIGIIDILMLYTFRKQVEHSYKSLFNRGEVSAIEPVEYAARFINFISETID
ncbi:putative phosphatidylinositol phosphate kinase [Tieghemostelium lacteum]|uniref:Putative phosphatidylinositol phosphate kinase n=1 Tax=Tieghemostelium lacteum TaxID=361077 RepID=A0A151ZIY5_TIELA|nr:putative phosphatidylinositol phosphate kinase [Tieghemostelium lacteum]|eukprot:KYQ93877.1 putative phosphatidylinositol phosphate kinase [Tieghemostelium lacteum]